MGSLEKCGTICDRLQTLAVEDPVKSAFIFWDKNLKRTVLTRQDVWDKSRKCAAFLRRQGIEKGDVVCNTLVNSKERLITTYGVMLAGGVTMQGQMLLSDGEDILMNWRDSHCQAVILSPKQEAISSLLEKLKHKDIETGKIRYEGLPHLKVVIPVTYGDDFTDQIEEERDMYVEEGIEEDDVFMIFTTSGSTGFIKLVEHTHRRCVIMETLLSKLIGYGKDSVFFNQRSLGWIGGAPIRYAVAGLTRVLVDQSCGIPEDTGAVFTHILEHDKCDTALIMPSAIQSIIDHLESMGKPKLSTPLHCIGTGGGPITKATMRALGRVTETIDAMYGATEFGITHGLRVGDKSSYEDNCIGLPADPDSTQTKIVDDNLEEVPPGESGEVLIRGPTVLVRYLNNSDGTKGCFLDGGWFRTSDIGHMDGKGQLFVYCRKSSAINYRGYIYYPGWIETKVDTHPEIKKSFVIGIPHPTDNERICLCLTLSPGSSLSIPEIEEFCMSLFAVSKNSDAIPIPKYYLFFDSFPQNANGKIDRKAVREIALRRVQEEYN